MNKPFQIRSKALSVENFRIFNDECRFEFKPITILVGPNGSGKTTLLKAMQFLSANAKLPHFPQKLKANFSEIGFIKF